MSCEPRPRVACRRLVQRLPHHPHCHSRHNCGDETVNQREARKRQQVIELTLAGLNEMLVNNKSLLAEMNPEQEQRLAELLVLGQDWLVQVDGE